MGQRIADDDIREFGVVVFDLNGLKEINDTKGHDAGERYTSMGKDRSRGAVDVLGMDSRIRHL